MLLYAKEYSFIKLLRNLIKNIKKYIININSLAVRAGARVGACRHAGLWALASPDQGMFSSFYRIMHR